jgi:hypothetical protein
MAAPRTSEGPFAALSLLEGHAHNAEPKPFRWTASADDILAKIARFAQRTLTPHPAP